MREYYLIFLGIDSLRCQEHDSKKALIMRSYEKCLGIGCAILLYIAPQLMPGHTSKDKRSTSFLASYTYLTSFLLQIRGGITTIGRTNYNINLGGMTAIIKMHRRFAPVMLEMPASRILQHQTKLLVIKNLTWLRNDWH